jgi:heme/copper-type cytochrome/quinol oxidase subunit 3
MADVYLSNDPQPQNSAEQITVTEENNIIKPEPQNMEVHHHPHSHGKKSFKTYLWEFLMLFLAVFCGFLQSIISNTGSKKKGVRNSSNLL